jgi:hypothetical protein
LYSDLCQGAQPAKKDLLSKGHGFKGCGKTPKVKRKVDKTISVAKALLIRMA